LIEEGYDPLAFRYLCLTAHYRSELVFTWESLSAAQKALFTLREHMRRFKENSEGEGEVKETAKTDEYRRAFLEAVNDDLNMPKALTVVWKLVREEKDLSDGEKYRLLLEFDKVLALDLEKEEFLEKLPEEAEILIRKREEARKAKDWATADKLREQLRAMGVIVEDTPQGVKWRIEKR